MPCTARSGPRGTAARTAGQLQAVHHCLPCGMVRSVPSIGPPAAGRSAGLAENQLARRTLGLLSAAASQSSSGACTVTTTVCTSPSLARGPPDRPLARATVVEGRQQWLARDGMRARPPTPFGHLPHGSYPADQARCRARVRAGAKRMLSGGGLQMIRVHRHCRQPSRMRLACFSCGQDAACRAAFGPSSASAQKSIMCQTVITRQSARRVTVHERSAHRGLRWRAGASSPDGCPHRTW